MKTPNFLNVFNISKALYLLENCLDYSDIGDDHLLVVAFDNTVWVCKDTGSCLLNDYKLVQRII